MMNGISIKCGRVQKVQAVCLCFEFVNKMGDYEHKQSTVQKGKI